MNLIEQLGYEYAKEIYLSNLEDFSGNASGATISTEKLRFTHEELEKALLEYRRQHNIFEVGDLSLTIDPWFGSNLLTVVDFRKSETERYAIFSDGGFFRISGLRHATAAEIKAGKRLEVV